MARPEDLTICFRDGGWLFESPRVYLWLSGDRVTAHEALEIARELASPTSGRVVVKP